MDEKLLASMLEEGCVSDQMLKLIMHHCLEVVLSRVNEPFGTVSAWYVKDQLETVKKCLELLGVGCSLEYAKAETE